MFNEGVSTQQKILGYLVLIFCILFLYSLFSSTLIFDHISLLFLYLSIAISLFFFILFIVFYRQKNTKIKQEMYKGGHDTLSVVVIMPVAIFMITYAGVAISLPNVLHSLMSVQSEIHVSVKRTSSSYAGSSSRYSSTCTGKVYLVDFNYLKSDYVCGVQREDWVQLKKGGELILSGNESIFGFNYTSYKRLTKRINRIL
jgi:heme/copper-type cytochrome/quinol oxidase subunit 2